MKPETGNLKHEIPDAMLRAFGVGILLAAAVCILQGCTWPKTVNFAPLVEIHDTANGSANGNTVTPVAP